MSVAVRRRALARVIRLDRSLESLPLFRLSDSSESTDVTYFDDHGLSWSVIAASGERIPGTFDQDVYVELMRRYAESGDANGTVSFTLHSFLRGMRRRVDGRAYELLRASLNRLQGTRLVSDGAYEGHKTGRDAIAFSLLAEVNIERRRIIDREQLALFPSIAGAEPGVARVRLHDLIRGNVDHKHVVSVSGPVYWALDSAVARRIYRLVEVARAEERLTWRVSLERLAQQLPLAQRYPSQLQRVLKPAHDILVSAGVLRSAAIRQHQREWYADYVLGSRPR